MNKNVQLKPVSKRLLSATLICMTITIWGCSHERENCIKNIKAAESKMKNATKVDIGSANNAINLYVNFTNRFPKDSLSPQFLYKAAMLAMSVSQYNRALALYDTIYAAYPDFRQASDCIFVQGYIYDNFLKDTAKAHAKYQEVINKFPNDKLAQDAKAAISDLGKSNEEIIKEFEEKNKGKDTAKTKQSI